MLGEFITKQIAEMLTNVQNSYCFRCTKYTAVVRFSLIAAWHVCLWYDVSFILIVYSVLRYYRHIADEKCV